MKELLKREYAKLNKGEELKVEGDNVTLVLYDIDEAGDFSFTCYYEKSQTFESEIIDASKIDDYLADFQGASIFKIAYTRVN